MLSVDWRTSEAVDALGRRFALIRRQRAAAPTTASVSRQPRDDEAYEAAPPAEVVAAVAAVTPPPPPSEAPSRSPLPAASPPRTTSPASPASASSPYSSYSPRSPLGSVAAAASRVRLRSPCLSPHAYPEGGAGLEGTLVSVVGGGGHGNAVYRVHLDIDEPEKQVEVATEFVEAISQGRGQSGNNGGNSRSGGGGGGGDPELREVLRQLKVMQSAGSSASTSIGGGDGGGGMAACVRQVVSYLRNASSLRQGGGGSRAFTVRTDDPEFQPVDCTEGFDLMIACGFDYAYDGARLILQLSDAKPQAAVDKFIGCLEDFLARFP